MRRPRSTYHAYIDVGSREECCGQGHTTQEKAHACAAKVRKERAERKR